MVMAVIPQMRLSGLGQYYINRIGSEIFVVVFSNYEEARGWIFDGSVCDSGLVCSKDSG